MGLGKVFKKAAGVVGAAAGAYFGGPVGASLGYSLGNSLSNSDESDAKSLYKWQLGVQTDNNIRLWNMNNAYNSPKAQMERFKEAGLNPNLIYGQTNTASPISSASASYDLNQTENQKALSNYMALSNLGIQKDLSSAQVRNIDNSIDMSRLNYGLARDKLELERDRLNLDAEMANAGWLGHIFGKKRGNDAWNWLFGPHPDVMGPDMDDFK